MQSATAVALPLWSRTQRDELWLSDTLERIWQSHFADTPRLNDVSVGFGAAWKTRLGLITMSEDEETTYIQVNALLRRMEVPEFVTSVTVAHEMVHYAHGFGSPLPRRYKHPHRGGIVKRELLRRGMAEEYERYDDWVYTHWYDFYERCPHCPWQRSKTIFLPGLRRWHEPRRPAPGRAGPRRARPGPDE